MMLQCMTFVGMMDEIQDPSGTCDIAIGAITITAARQEQGIQFSYP